MSTRVAGGVRRRLSALLAVVVASTPAALAAAGAAGAPADPWSPLQEAGGSTLAVVLDDRTTALVSVGGPDDATIYDQRRTADGTLGPSTAVMSVDGAEACVPVDAATAAGNLAVAVECRVRTGSEEPPTRLVELVWTGDDGWVWHVQGEGELGSVDYSPQGQYAVFASNSSYGRPHHLTSYHPDLGWRDLTRRELAPTGDDLVAAITDSGNVVTLRGAGFEDEPGYFFGGRLRIETYSSSTRTWRQRFTRADPDGGFAPAGIDVAAGRILATVVRSRSTGKLNGLADKVLVLSGTPRDPRTWRTPRWSREVLTASAAITQAGVGVAGWQSVVEGRAAEASFATWSPARKRPSVQALVGRTTLTVAAQAGRTLDLSVSADGHGILAHVERLPGADQATVTGSSFVVGADGVLSGQVDTSWQQPVDTTVDVIAAATTSSLTLGRLSNTFLQSPIVRYSVGP